MEPPDAQEKRIRFGFGFIIGLFFGSFSWIAFNAANVYYFAAFVVAFALLCGFGALKYGDEFWVSMFTRSSRWWWWF
jgi:hypothetical protein